MKDIIEHQHPTRQLDDLNPFYTRTEVGDLLSSILEITAPKKVLDLGAGEGSLTRAVNDRWPNAGCTTVDVSEIATKNLLHMFATSNTDHNHHHWDVLTKELPHGLTEDSFDLAVCNPPFFRPNLSSDHLEILSLAGLRDACPQASDNRAEILFLAQNIRLVRTGGTIALIAPDSLLTGHRFRKFRAAILNRYNVTCVMQLPGHSFHNTEARCFFLVLRKEPPRKQQAIKLLRHKKNGTLPAIWIDMHRAVDRMDYDFHASQPDDAHLGFCLHDLDADVRRGSFSTVQRKSMQEPIFHTTDFKSFASGQVDFCDFTIPRQPNAIIAETGDILMARVDRSLHKKLAIVTTGKAAITDCVYRIRLPKEHQKLAFSALRSEHGQQTLQSATKGVSARLLGKEVLLNLRLKEPLFS